MTIYEFTAPNGRVRKIEGPEDATDAELMYHAKRIYGEDLLSEPTGGRTLGSIAGDVGTALKKGAVGAGQSLVGLADIPTGGAAGKALEPYVDLAGMQEQLSAEYSPEQQAAIKQLQEAQGFGGVLQAAVERPSAVLSSIGESAPSMLLGGVYGKAAKGIAGLGRFGAAGLGEGLVGAGAAAEQYREESPTGDLSGKETLSALGSGAVSGLLGSAVGKLAGARGISDIDTLLIRGGADDVAKAGFLKQMAGAGVAEGLFEELPQSAQEQMWRNYATDRPLLEGVEEAAAKGLITGATMGSLGGGYSAMQAKPSTDQTETEQAGAEDYMPDTKQAWDEELARKEKSAMVSEWAGSERSGLYNQLMDLDLTTHEGLDAAEELLSGTNVGTGGGSAVAVADLEDLRAKAGERETPETEAEAPVTTPETEAPIETPEQVPPVETPEAEAPVETPEAPVATPAPEPVAIPDDSLLHHLSAAKNYASPVMIRKDLEAALGKDVVAQELKQDKNFIKNVWEEYKQARPAAPVAPATRVPPVDFTAPTTAPKQGKPDKLTTLADLIETKAFDETAAYRNTIGREMEKKGVSRKDIVRAMEKMDTSLTVHAGNTAAEAVRQGGIKFNPALDAYEATPTGETIGKAEQQVRAMGEAAPIKLTEEEANATYHNFMVARRIKEMMDAARAVEKEASKTEATQGKVAAQQYKRRHKTVLDLARNAAGLNVSEAQIDATIEDALKKMPNLLDDDGPVATVNKLLDNTVNTMVEAGRLSRKQAAQWRQNAAYIPFNRVMESEDPDEIINNPHAIISSGITSGMTLKGIKGSSKQVGNVLKNLEAWQMKMTTMAIKNKKALDMVDTAMAYMPKGFVTEVAKSEPGAVAVYRHGKKEFYKFADPLFADAFTGLQSVSPKASELLKLGSKYGDMLRKFIVLDPLFSISQLPQDTYAAMTASGLRNPLALLTEVVKQSASLVAGKETTARARLKATGVIGKDYSKEQLMRDLDMATGLRKAPEGFTEKFTQKLGAFADASDAVLRQAVYARTMKELQGDPKAESEAARRAADIINFKRRGTSSTLNALRQITPFLGAYLQATRVAYLTLSNKGITPGQRKQALTNLAYTVPQLMVFSLVYAALMSDDDEFKKRSTDERDSKLYVFGSDVGIPLRKDWTLLPHVVAMHAYDELVSHLEDPETNKEAVKTAVANALLGAPKGPALFRPVLETLVNKNFSTGTPIVGRGLESAMPSEQYTPSTSELGKLAGAATAGGAVEVSPAIFDHLFKGYLGTVGGMMLAMTDSALRAGLDLPYAETTVQEKIRKFMPGSRAFVSKEIPGGDMAKYYDLQRTIDKTQTTKRVLESRDPDKAEAYLESKGELASRWLSHTMSIKQKQLGELRKQENEILATPNKVLSPADKRTQLDEIEADRKDLLSDMQEIRNEVYPRSR
jgi:hypothetical protein